MIKRFEKFELNRLSSITGGMNYKDHSDNGGIPPDEQDKYSLFPYSNRDHCDDRGLPPDGAKK
ncbi:hypothetical protein ACOSP6_03375 [Tenacibaculum sp. MEBiC06402]|uniref:hypothetical protein n=1 Tax=unclassified Tenacibaculum TaxID=2635139 RepID=UPI003B9B4CEA